MLDSLNRTTLSAQATAAIRTAIKAGEWTRLLPSERWLSEHLQISRPTLRNALQVLAQEGLLEIRHGRRVRILTVAHPKPAAESRVVGIVSLIARPRMPHHAQIILSELEAQLARNGVVTEVLAFPHRNVPTTFKTIERFVDQNQISCCLLVGCSREVQQWFARQPLPVLLLGSSHAGIELPSVDFDYRAICRHAAGVALGKGHRSLGLVVHQSGLAGDLLSEQGFCEAIQRHAGAGEVHHAIVRHAGTARSIGERLDAAFKSNPAPTALIVTGIWEVFAVTIHLLRRGVAIPESVTLIARDYDALFDAIAPRIAHYRFKGNTFTHHVSRLAQRLLSTGRILPRPTRLLPTFFPGDTVRPPGSAAPPRPPPR